MNIMKVGDRITVHDRKMKTHTFSGEITSIEETLENKKIYNVLIEMRNIEGKLTKVKKNITLPKIFS